MRTGCGFLKGNAAGEGRALTRQTRQIEFRAGFAVERTLLARLKDLLYGWQGPGAELGLLDVNRQRAGRLVAGEQQVILAGGQGRVWV